MITSMGTTNNAHFLIADSSGLISLASLADQNHQAARDAFANLKQTPCTIVIPGDIFTETINTLNKRAPHELAAGTAAYLMHTPPFLLSEATPEIRREALNRFQAQGNAALSYADQVVMSFADAFDTRELFAFDEGMKKQGYTILHPEEVQEAT
jgi:predicted nucleic acid-binding protein